jgi:glycosyltransferase involved in cell wall biosynthesis
MRRLRVCIDARMPTGLLGGVEQVVIGLAHGLSKLDDGSEEYLFLTTPGEDEWIRRHLDGPCRTMTLGQPPIWAARGYLIRRVLSRRLPWIQRELTPPPAPKDLMVSDGTIEWAGVDVIHFPCQMAFLTEIPSIYHPHDLQHLHLPELHPARDVELRELWYRAFCEQASLVVMMTNWGREDVINHYGLPPDKVAAIPWGSVLDAYPEPAPDDISATREDLGLPETFILYPANTWSHKNHERLLEALALIRSRHGVTIPLVCTGRQTPHYDTLRKRVTELGLAGSVWFAGFVSPLQLRCLYAIARAMVFPSRFEGWGMPVSEAFAAGVPVASSSATGLPEVAGDAALIFDPEETDQIADRVWRVWTDRDLRATLVARGKRRVGETSVERAARVFRAHYRRISGGRLTPEDRELLAEPRAVSAEA